MKTFLKALFIVKKSPQNMTFYTYLLIIVELATKKTANSMVFTLEYVSEFTYSITYDVMSHIN